MVNARLGGMNAAILTLDSVNFGELATNLQADRHQANEKLFIEAALRLQAANCEALMICANTPHIYAQAVSNRVNLPLIHIADVVRDAIQLRGLTRVALMGTKWTMERDIYQSTLRQAEIEVIVPDTDDRLMIDRSVFEELGRNIFTDERRAAYQEVFIRLIADDAQGVILGCTEIPLLLPPDQIPIPSFDTVAIHSAAAADFILGD